MNNLRRWTNYPVIWLMLQPTQQYALNLLPSNSEDWSQLGVILAKQQKYEDAAAAFRRAFQLNSRGRVVITKSGAVTEGSGAA